MATTAPDRRFRPYRAAMYAAYLVMVVGVSSFLIYSVVRSTLEMTGRLHPLSPERLTSDQCFGRVRSMLDELEARRHALSESPVVSADRRWLRFRGEWIVRLRGLKLGCEEPSSQDPGLKRSLKLLDKASDLYTTHAVQFSGEVGPTLDELRSKLSSAGR